MKELPSRLTPSPIVSAVVEMRFSIDLPIDAVFGAFYPLLSRDFSELKKLPILQIPSDIREKDSVLINSPYYELTNSKDGILKILIGPKVLIVAFNKTEENNYPGWIDYIEEKILDIYKRVFDSHMIKSVLRFGIRYVNFFEDNIFYNTNLEILQDKQNIALSEKMQISRSFIEDGINHNLIVSNNANIVINNKVKFGSIIDVDSYIEKEFESFDYRKYLDSYHKANKKQFFSLLKKKYIDDKFNAVYKGEQ